VAVFYETNKLEGDDQFFSDTYSGYQRVSPTTPAGTSIYTGQQDGFTRTRNGDDFELEDEAHNFLLGYSMDFGMFSLGLTVNPEWRDREVTLDDRTYTAGISGSVFGIPNAFSIPFSVDAPGVGTPSAGYSFSESFNAAAISTTNALAGSGSIGVGLNRSTSTETVSYANVAQSKYTRTFTSTTFDGDEDIEDRDYEVELGTHIRPSDHYHIEFSVSYEDVDHDVDGHATYAFDSSTVGVGNYDPAALETGDFPLLPAITNGASTRTTTTSTWDGAITDTERDGDVWGITIRPTYEVNDLVALELDLAYRTGDGDISGGNRQVVDYDRTAVTDSSDTDPELYRADEVFDNTFDGDWDLDAYHVEPRVYLSFDAVRFSLGVGYAREERDRDWVTRRDATSTLSYNDGDGVVSGDADDWTASATRVDYSTTDWEEEITTWSFPVATEFDVTDKLTLRAGARFSRIKIEEESDSYSFDEETKGQVTLGDGTIVAFDASQVLTAGGSPTPYDPNTNTVSTSGDEEDTEDRTDYRLGLGYQATENLAFDLMFAGSDADNGGVDMRTVWASVVLAF
jgi:hypothetical protein